MIKRKFTLENSAKRKVLAHLKKYGVITRDIARYLYHTDSLSKIVYELNGEGENIQIRTKICPSYDKNGNPIKVSEYYLPSTNLLNDTEKLVIIYKVLDNKFKIWRGTVPELLNTYLTPEFFTDEFGKKWKIDYKIQGNNKVKIQAHRFFRKRIFTFIEWCRVYIGTHGEFKITNDI